MSSSAIEPESPDLVCQLDKVQGVVDALTSVRWKRHQDAVVELSEHGIVLIVEETACLQAKVYLQREDIQVLLKYAILVLICNFFSIRSVDSSGACTYAEIRTRIPDTISWDYNFEPAGSTPLSFTVKSAALKEAIDDLEWPGSSIHLILQPTPPSVTFRGEGHGDLQIDFMCYANTDLLVAFHCDRQVSHRYKYKFLRATTSNIPSSVIRDNRGSKLTIGRGGMLKVQHLVSVAKPAMPHPHIDSAGYQQPSRIAYIEFFVKPEVDDDGANDT
ncbi:uncharacterized protein LOC107805580 isoform X2 [Nicotiana tabacum]|uniref:Uncharacterized protein LOC107805580 isoform X2 n=1 Tax=Nicotiana tabacum TaxID=4097 RepID=A0A1S4B8B6_TOBAC|nr:PREDICTED: uncharacterized protein LOC107805580 isoform X2 [Nicotiana tabacum]